MKRSEKNFWQGYRHITTDRTSCFAHKASEENFLNALQKWNIFLGPGPWGEIFIQVFFPFDMTRCIKATDWFFEVSVRPSRTDLFANSLATKLYDLTQDDIEMISLEACVKIR